MHRITRRDLRALIYVSIRTAPTLVLTKLRSKLPADGDKAAGELADRISERLDNGSTMVIRTELKGTTHPQLGKWGEDEPDPTSGSNWP